MAKRPYKEKEENTLYDLSIEQMMPLRAKRTKNVLLAIKTTKYSLE